MVEGEIRRDVTLRPLTGALERALAEQVAAPGSWPERVTLMLTSAIEQLAGTAPTRARVEALSVGDRQYLLLHLSELICGDHFWTTLRCEGCGARFDVALRRSSLPVKQAGEGYPFAVLTQHGRRIKLRVPTGADQAQLPGLSPAAATRRLVACCLLTVDDSPPGPGFAATLDDAAIGAIEQALDLAAPDLGTTIQTACAECGREQVFPIDPFFDRDWGDGLDSEVHLIATHYHWSEAEILALPRARRGRYLALIDQARGLYH